MRILAPSYIRDGFLMKHGTSSTHEIEFAVPKLELIRRRGARIQTERCMPYDRSTGRVVECLCRCETTRMPVNEHSRQYHGATKISGKATINEVFKRLSFDVENQPESVR